MYFIYGLVLVNIFKLVTTQLAVFQIWLYKVLGVVGIVLGGFNIKDFFAYGAGGIVTEVPRKWRPKMKGLIARI